METKRFQFSEEGIKGIKMRALLMGLIFIPVSVFCISIVKNVIGNELRVLAGIALFVIPLLVVETTIAVASLLVLRMMKGLVIKVSDESIERRGGKYTEVVDYQDLTLVAARENRVGKIVSIQLHTPSGKILIGGVNDMNLLLDKILRHTPENVKVQRKRIRVDLSHPLTFSLCFTLVAAVSAGLFAYLLGLGENVYRLFIALVTILYGVYGLAYRPLSKSVGVRFQKLEVVLLAVSIVSGVMILLILLMIWR